jgi:hypothetical protein
MALGARGLGDQLPMSGKRLLGLGEEALTIRSQAHATGRALEELEIELILDRLDVSAHGRLTQVQEPRRARDASLARHDHERLELIAVHYPPPGVDNRRR